MRIYLSPGAIISMDCDHHPRDRAAPYIVAGISNRKLFQAARKYRLHI